MIYNTESRQKILEFLKDNKENSFSAENIFLALRVFGIGKSTVFRQLRRLTEENSVRRISDGVGRRVEYQYLDSDVCREHLHLKCKRCGKLIHLDGEISHLFEEKILKSEHFAIDESALLSGTCELCLVGEGEA